MTARPITDYIDAVDDVLLTTLSLARDLTEADAERPTECPGWTVRDQLAHMVGLEQVLGGAPQPDVQLPELDHVVSDIDVFMEQQIQVRRQLPLSAIADEMAGLRRRRVAELRRLATQGDPLVKAPRGERALSAALPVRAFDLWVHEQDIRRAVGLRVRVEGPAAAIALERSLLGWSVALPKQLGVDTDVVVVVRGPEPSETTIPVGTGGRAVTITGDLGQITGWFCGRSVPTDDQITGDATAVGIVRAGLALTP